MNAARILNTAQAEAVYSAMCALNNVSAKVRTEMSGLPDYSIVTVHERGNGQVWVEGDRGVREEIYADQSAFATAYSLAQG
jgi:hypothetical protein